ncbi:DUF6676 family protein [Corynebacterium meitnerae]|uniref:1-deoxy-D-xylulose-5-phosphate synthase n=1 Tax=Corynebacterium meitnerae TaxID=2913498 RepID=A0A9X3LSY8_9CORY|nr:DUF6676 family protein [Corynebacterium meitnerae]MCZ9293039.1 hypothetical protein [Corynebacterium meitnerae]
MAPVNVDKASLSAQLADDGVAFETDNPVNLLIEPDLLRVTQEANQTDNGPFGFIVLEQVGVGPGALRDLAQEMLDETDTNTVIVRTPDATAAVSNTLTRAQIEGAQFALIRQPDYAQGIDAFVAETSQPGPAWAGLGVFFVAVVAVVALATRVSVKR